MLQILMFKTRNIQVLDKAQVQTGEIIYDARILVWPRGCGGDPSVSTFVSGGSEQLPQAISN